MNDDIGGVWRTIGGRKIFIKDGQDLASAMKESGKFSKNTNPIYSVKANIKTSENFQNKIDSQVQENIVQYTQELTDKYQDTLLQENIVWKTFIRSEDEVANSAYNLNPNYFKDIEESRTFIRDKMNNGNYVTCDDELKYIVAHEVGHNVQIGLYNQLTDDKIRSVKGCEKYCTNFMRKVISKYEQETNNSFTWDLCAKEVSKYATSNKKGIELFAESFAEYTSSSNPREFALAFGEILEEEKKKLK